MSRWIIIGVGDRKRSDDGGGVRAVEELSRQRPDLSCLSVSRLGPELAEPVSGATAVVFVHASVLVRSVSINHLRPGHGDVASHVATPDVLLGLCELLHGDVPRAAFLVEIPAHDLGPGETLSSGTEAAVGEAVAVLLRLVRDEVGERHSDVSR